MELQELLQMYTGLSQRHRGDKTHFGGKTKDFDRFATKKCSLRWGIVMKIPSLSEKNAIFIADVAKREICLLDARSWIS
jgi:hypothetical protein